MQHVVQRAFTPLRIGGLLSKRCRPGPNNEPGSWHIGFPGSGKKALKKRDTGVEPVYSNSQDVISHALPTTPSEDLAQTLARETQTGADLARVVDAWPTLAEPIRRAILALIGT